MPKSNNQRFNKPQRRLSPKNQPKQPNNNWLFWITLGFIFLILMSQTSTVSTIKTAKELTYSEFYSILLSNPETGRIQKLELVESAENSLKGVFDNGTEFSLHIPKNDEPLLELIRSNVENFTVAPPHTSAVLGETKTPAGSVPRGCRRSGCPRRHSPSARCRTPSCRGTPRACTHQRTQPAWAGTGQSRHPVRLPPPVPPEL